MSGFDRVTLTSSFEKMNKELTNVSSWFNANKLSLNVKKDSFFQKSSKKDNISLRLPNLNINGFTVKSESSIMFLGVCIDENLTWRDRIHTVENNIAKKYWTHIKESITSMINASSRSTLLTYMLI